MSAAGALSFLLAYLLGGVPFGLILFRLAGRGDIRERGSGNIGATNVMRAGGRALGIATFILDAGKGSAAVWMARLIAGASPWPEAAALGAILGHCFPVLARFRGGKGIATGCGAFMALAPLPTALALALFAVVTAATRMVSAGSIAAALCLPALILWLQPDGALLASAAACVLVAIVRHVSNIRRMLRGEEHRVAARGDDTREAARARGGTSK